MELRQYWNIVWKRIWIPASLVLVVLAASLALRGTPAPQYRASARILVDVPPLQVTEGMGFDPRLTAPQATEYLVDDFSVFVTGDAVAEAVSQRLSTQGIQLPAGIIHSSTASQQIHRVVELQVTWHNPEEAVAIIGAAIEVLEQEAPAFFGRLGAMQPMVTLFDGPTVGAVPPSLRQRLDIPIRLGLALIAGLALCFIIDYLDDSVRNGRELEAMGIEVLAQVPRRR